MDPFAILDAPKAAKPLRRGLGLSSVALALITATRARQDWETVKSQVGGLTSEATIATFLAAVQSQILALSFQDNSTSLKITTNAFGFVGILLDVITACLALLASTVLQRHIAVIEQQLDAIEDASSEQLVEMSHFLKQSPLLRRAAEMFPDIYRRVQAKMEARAIVLRRAQESTDAHLTRLPASPRLNIEVVPESMGHIRGAAPIGDAAGTAMLIGVLSFFASVICLAISTQPHEVWVISISVCTLVLVLPTVNSLLGRVGRRLPSVFDI
ncbi:hypothetical protein MVEN_01719800 [Mycena venus]|uniref:Uncharacterized protein n=1 Tax=Mycena venus TaxID=2733690 RepID=A0A8H6XPV6_9AGAR|nr:hypothetical protein MVEN_01719800 [Mycena venus]